MRFPNNPILFRIKPKFVNEAQNVNRVIEIRRFYACAYRSSEKSHGGTVIAAAIISSRFSKNDG